MAKETHQDRQNNLRSNIIIQIFLFIPYVLLITGDTVRLLYRGLSLLIGKSYSLIRLIVNDYKSRKSRIRQATPGIKKRFYSSQITNNISQFLQGVFSVILAKASLFKIYLQHQQSSQIPLPLLPKSIVKALYPPQHVLIRQKIHFVLIGVFLTLVFIFIPYITYYWLRTLPNPRLLTQRNIEVTTKIFDRNGVLLYEVYTDQNRTPLGLSDIPDLVKYATIAVEDRSFYHHQGFSLKAIARASMEFIVNKRIQGGSTITQQLIKSALLTPEVKISRKIKEIFLAFWAERLYTKNQILEMYLNQVPFGGTAWGIEAASQTYFGKSIKDLNLAETALLAGLPAAPSLYSPLGNTPQKAFERQALVLHRMLDDRYINKKQYEEALAAPVRLVPPRTLIRAPHFVMYVRQLLEQIYGPRVVDRGGLRITTSLDYSLQETVQDIVSSRVDELKNLHVGNGAALVTNPKTGEILAMVGSKDYFDLSAEGNVNVVVSLRQPGSSIKVVNYAQALENAVPAGPPAGRTGRQGFTAASILDDSPITFTQPGGKPYTPVNYDGTYHGLVPLRYALGNSYNIPAVKTLAKIGVPAMIAKGKLMGITSWNDESRFGLSLTLGGGEVTMLDMAKVYGTIANLGRRVDLTPILEVRDYTGRIIERKTSPKETNAVKPEIAWILANILSDNQARSQAFGSSSALVIPQKTVSVKTGTSNDKRDNWTIGFTPSYVAAVWVGNNDNSPMNPQLTSGVTGAAPIWHDIMVHLLQNKNDETIPRPSNIVSVPCFYDRPEYFIRGTEPSFGRCAPLPTPSQSPSPKP